MRAHHGQVNRASSMVIEMKSVQGIACYSLLVRDFWCLDESLTATLGLENVLAILTHNLRNSAEPGCKATVL